MLFVMRCFTKWAKTRSAMLLAEQLMPPTVRRWSWSFPRCARSTFSVNRAETCWDFLGCFSHNYSFTISSDIFTILSLFPCFTNVVRWNLQKFRECEYDWTPWRRHDLTWRFQRSIAMPGMAGHFLALYYLVLTNQHWKTDFNPSDHPHPKIRPACWKASRDVLPLIAWEDHNIAMWRNNASE